MRIRYTQTGKRPLTEVDNCDVIRACFMACPPPVRAELEAWLASSSEWKRFDFWGDGGDVGEGEMTSSPDKMSGVSAQQTLGASDVH
jgi:hypothetical protein